MALGGGVWTTQNKILPGSYINFISAARATVTLSERGVAAMPLMLDWGADDEIFSVTTAEFFEKSRVIFGYDFAHSSMKPMRDLYKNIRLGHFYRMNGNGTKAENSLATAKYSGIRGNALTIIVEKNEAFETGTNEIYDVTTTLESVVVDAQMAVKVMADLLPNAWVNWKPTATLAATAGEPLTGGANGLVINANHQTFLDKIEGFSFNVVGCPYTDPVIKALYVAFNKRMRDDVGVKFQCVVHKYPEADYWGVISVENNDTPELVYWVTGAAAGAPINGSNTNSPYTGEYPVITNHTQTELEAAIKSGKFVFHKVNEVVRILDDINTFTSFTDDNNSDFANNQTIRVLDQIGNDIAYEFNTRFLGNVPNDAAGRISFWNVIVKYNKQLETLRAIENFDPAGVTVEPGEQKKAITVVCPITVVNCMTQLYLTVVVS